MYDFEVNTKFLQEYAAFLHEKIAEISKDYLSMIDAAGLEIPQMSYQLPKEERLLYSENNFRKYLDDITNNRIRAIANNQLARIRENQLPDLGKQKIRAEDVLLDLSLRKKLLLKYSAQFTDDKEIILSIANGIESLNNSIQLIVINEFLNVKEKEGKLLTEVARDIISSSSIEEGTYVSLDVICNDLRIPAGEVWIVNYPDERIEMTTSYGRGKEKPPHDKTKFNSFKFGEGLPGYVWKTKKLYWIKDLKESKLFIRKNEMIKAGYKAVVGVPVPLGEEVIAVMLFYFYNRPEKNETITRIFNSISSQLGIFIKYRQNGQTLKESELRFRLIFESAPTGIIFTNKDGNIISINKVAEQLLGYSTDELTDKHFSFIKPKRYHKAIKKLLTEKAHTEEISFAKSSIEMHVLRKNSTEILVELSIGSYISNGEHYYIEVINDITDKRDKEKALQRMARIVNDSDDAILSLSLDGNIETWNRAAEKIYGYKASEVKGKHISIISTDKKNKEIKSLLKKINSGKRIYHIDTQRKRKDGKIIDVSLTISPLKDRSGKVIGISSVTRDITEKVKAQEEKNKLIEQLNRLNEELESKVVERTEELARTNKELSDFTYMVSHDLKAPLRNISSLAGLLIEENRSKLDKESLETLDHLQKSVSGLNNMIVGLLEYTRADRLSSPEEVNLNIIVSEIINLIGIPSHIKVKIDRKLPVIIYPEVAIRQIFQNLIDNSVKYNDKTRGKINIGYTKKGKFYEFYIKDNGVGIPRKAKDKVFKMFSTVNLKNYQSSTGIGLAVVKKLIERQGGEIWFESQKVKGTVFYFTVPVS